MTRLLTPAPRYHAQLGWLDGRVYRADYFSETGRLAWRRLPWWHLEALLEYWMRRFADPYDGGAVALEEVAPGHVGLRARGGL